MNISFEALRLAHTLFIQTTFKLPKKLPRKEGKKMPPKFFSPILSTLTSQIPLQINQNQIVFFSFHFLHNKICTRIVFARPSSVYAQGERERDDLRCFVDNLLDIVLAEAAITCVVDLVDERDGFGLAHCHHPHVIGPAAGFLRGLTDSVEHRPQGRHGRTLQGGSNHHHSLISLRLTYLSEFSRFVVRIARFWVVCIIQLMKLWLVVNVILTF